MSCCVGDCCVGNCGFCCVMDFCGDSCCVGYTSTSNDSAEHARKINEEFNKLKEDYENQAAAQEQTIIDQINASMDMFIDSLERINGEKYSGRALNINIKKIREEREKLSKEVVGFIGNQLHDKIVMTDPKLAEILKEKDDEKRNKNTNEFCKKVLNDAKKELKKQIKKTVKAQQDVIHKELDSRLAEIDASMEKSLAAYNELVESANKGDYEKDRLVVQAMYQYDIYNLISEKIGIADDDISVRKSGPIKLKQ